MKPSPNSVVTPDGKRIWHRTCKVCDGPFTTDKFRQDYCSVECKYPAKACVACGEQFITRNYRVQIYCSKRCAASIRDMAAVRRKVKTVRGGRPDPKPCNVCGATYQPTSSRQRICTTCTPNRSMSARMRRYGLTQAQWDAMKAKHDGRCWICKQGPAEAVDHCHATGRVRGALCTACNHVLHWVERPDWWVSALEYLNQGGDGSGQDPKDVQ